MQVFGTVEEERMQLDFGASDEEDGFVEAEKGYDDRTREEENCIVYEATQQQIHESNSAGQATINKDEFRTYAFQVTLKPSAWYECL